MENPESEAAWNIVEHTGMSLFLTGKAGTGKTTFLHKVVKESNKRLVVLAPTGIAAINAGGSTIHSFFQLPFSPYIPGSNPSDLKYQKMTRTKKKIIRSLDLIIIDEISMVRADLLDEIDMVLRRIRRVPLPFGGVQLLLIGDLQQLPPVANEADMRLLQPYYPSLFFFESRALSSIRYEMVELKKIYRQTDEEFISILNAIRCNKADAEVLARLNSRYIPGFTPPVTPKYIRLTTHNELARRINEDQLACIKSKEWSHKAKVQGSFPESSFPTDMELRLKVGAQVMFVKNDSGANRRYYNGMIGVVEALEEDAVYVRPDEGGETLCIRAESWENTSYMLDPETEELKERIDGTFSQYPLRLAWAITIHKSQGLTFSNAVIDASRSFAHGQCYVALSRCRNMEGMVLESPLTQNAIICDNHVTAFIESCARRALSHEQVESMAEEYRIILLDELFDFTTGRNMLADCRHIVEEVFSELYSGLVKQWRILEAEFSPRLQEVGAKFGRQYRSLLAGGCDEARFDERMRAASGYFSEELKRIRKLISDTPRTVDNARLEKQLNDKMTAFSEYISLKYLMFEKFRETPFGVDVYLKSKSKIMMDLEDAVSLPGKPNVKKEKRKEPKVWVPAANGDISNPRIYRALQLWRRDKMKELDVAAFMILSTKVLKAISESMPRTREELLAVPGIGPTKADNFGEEIIAIVRENI